MIQTEPDGLPFDFGPAEGPAATGSDQLFDRAMAVAFAPDGRGGELTRPAPDPAPSFPRKVPGRYQVIEPIAHGGQGVVVRVRDTNLGRELALNTIHTDPAGDRRARARLRAEACVLASLDHLGVPPVHERDYLPDGRPFFTMRLVR